MCLYDICKYTIFFESIVRNWHGGYEEILRAASDGRLFILRLQ